MAKIVVDFVAVTGAFVTDVQRATKQFEREIKAMQNTARQVGQVLGAALATSATAITAITKSSIDAADHVNDLAKKIGISAKSMSELGFAASRSGSDIDAMAAGLVKLSKSAVDNADVFASLGIAVKDAQGNLKGADVLFKQLADKFVQFKDGPEEVALAIKLFGKSGADLVQTLNNGSQGIDELIGRAHSLGAVISDDLASQADQFNDTLADLRSLMTGVGNSIAQAVLPTLQAFADSMLESGNQTRKSSDDFRFLADGMKLVAVGASIVKNGIEGATSVIAGMADTAAAAFDLIVIKVQNAKALIEALSTGNLALVNSVSDATAKASDAAQKEFDASIKKAVEASNAGLSESIGDITRAFEAAYGPAVKTGEAIAGVGEKAGTARVPIAALAGAQKDATKQADALAKATDDASKFLSSLRGDIGPITKAYEDYNKTLIEANEKSRELAKAGKSLADAQDFLADATEAANDQLENELATLEKQADVYGRYLKDLRDDSALIGLTERQHDIEQAVRRVREEYEQLNPELQKLAGNWDDIEPKIRANEGAFYDLSRATEASQAQIESFQQIISNGFYSVADTIADALTGAFKSFKDFGKALLDIAKQAVAEIIAQFIKLRVIQPLLAGLFGGSGTSLAQGLQSQVAGSAMGSQNGWLSQIFGGSGGGMGGIGQWVGANSGTIGTVGAWGGALGGALYGSTRGSGGLSTGLSTAAGAIGGYYAGTALATTAIGGATAGAAGATAAGSAALGAIPVVGWIALAALLIDKFSGGKLFGTKYKAENSQIGLDITDMGGSAWAGVWETRQKALFGGKTGRWKDLAAPEEAIKAAQEIFDNLTKTMEDGAKALGVDVPSLVEGSFKTITEYTKKGAVKSTKNIVEILGKTYEETSEQFVQRLNAENLIALVDASGAAGFATKMAEQWRSSAETLAQGAQTLYAIQLDLHNGYELLADPGNLEQVVKYLEDQAAANESLAQTYARLAQASEQYRQLVAGVDQAIASFGPQGTQFEQAFKAIFENSKAMSDQLNAAAKAAGLTAARTEDLTKVQKLAALQAKLLIGQLESLITQQAAELFGTPVDRQVQALNAQAEALNNQIEQLGAMGLAAVGQSTPLFGQRDAILKQIEDIQKKAAEEQAKLQRAAMAQEFSKNIADFALASGLNFDDIATKFGFGLDELGDALGLNSQELSDYLSGLEAQASTFINIEDLVSASNALLESILDAIRGGSPESDGSLNNYEKTYDPLTAAGPKVASLQVEAQSQIGTKLDRLTESVERLIQVNVEGNVGNSDALQDVATGLRGIARDNGLASNSRPRNTPRMLPAGVR